MQQRGAGVLATPPRRPEHPSTVPHVDGGRVATSRYRVRDHKTTGQNHPERTPTKRLAAYAGGARIHRSA